MHLPVRLRITFLSIFLSIVTLLGKQAEQVKGAVGTSGESESISSLFRSNALSPFAGIPEITLMAPKGPLDADTPFEVQVIISGTADLAGFEFELFHEPTLVEINNVELSDFIGKTDACNPDIERCAFFLGPKNSLLRTTLGAYSYGNGPGANGNGVALTLQMLPSGEEGETVLIVKSPLFASTQGTPQFSETSQLRLSFVRETGGTVFLPLVLKNADGGYSPDFLGTNDDSEYLDAVLQAGLDGLGILATTEFVQLEVRTTTAANPDVNLDGGVDILDLQLVAAAIGSTRTSQDLNPAYDLNGDLQVDIDDLQLVVSRWKSGLTVISSSSPASGSVDVAVTRETIIRFSSPINASTINTQTIKASFGGQHLNARVHIAPDNLSATLFYQDPLPASARVQVSVEGDSIFDLDGFLLDGDQDGMPGGQGNIDFDTLSLTVISGTVVCGNVIASELADDGSGGTEDMPLEGATITVDGKEGSLFTVTNAAGDFCLDPAPSGKFFVHVDGRTATNNVPPGAYYPYVGTPWVSIPGQTIDVGVVHLPLVQPDTLQPVSTDSDTVIHFAPVVLEDYPEFADVNITVPADSLYANDGTRGGQVGIAPVPPDRLPGTLPLSLDPPVVITVQTDGATNFDIPAPVCFPNLDDTPPGQNASLYSFNHDAGQWEVVGTMTVSENGLLVCTDPGSGILAPGWHLAGRLPIRPRHDYPDPDEIDEIEPGWAGSDSLIKSMYDLYSQDTDRCRNYLDEDDSDPLDDPTAFIEAYEKYRACVVDVAACAGNAAKNAFGAPGTGFGLPISGLEDVVDFAKDELETIISEEIGVPFPPRRIDSDLLFPNSLSSTVEVIEQSVLEVTSPFQGAILSATVRLTITAELSGLVSIGDSAQIFDLETFGFSSEADGTLIVTAIESSTRVVAHLQIIDLLPITDPFQNAISRQAPDNAPPYPVYYVAEIERPEGMMYLRGSTGPSGDYSLFIPNDGTILTVSFYDPITHQYGLIIYIDGIPALPRFVLAPVDESFTDLDLDGLPDLVEKVFGTDIEDPDTDGDGVLDGAEIQQGTDPLDGIPAATGIIASVNTEGNTVDVCAVNNLAVVAGSQAGISVLDVSSGVNPIIIAQLDTPGDAQRVACAVDTIAIADGTAGLTIVDFSDPPAA